MRGQPMKPIRYPLTITLLCLALLVPCATPPLAARAATRRPVPPAEEGSAPAVKISPDLLPARESGVSQTNLRPVAEQARAIVQTDGMTDAALEQFAAARGGRVLRHFGSFGAAAVELPA